ncbi:MBG domain-containing protein [Echinicola sp. 20G]|uniref:MBG domain-containing protein n=1 Tax=Echinicola sp. 20G TaxID=2781961 RepID=UPI001910B3C6|nr:MBG domain-containing protein [Echinicola sp. 20G]
MKNYYSTILTKGFLFLVVGLLNLFHVYGQSFTETFDDDPGFSSSSNDFTNDGIRFQISGTMPSYTNQTSNSTFSLSEGGGSDYALQFDVNSSTGINEIIISLVSGGNFSLNSLSFDILADANIIFSTGSGGNVSFVSNNSYVLNRNYDFSSETGFDNISSFTISGGNMVVDLDDLSYTISSSGNVDPTITGLPTDITVGEDAVSDVFDISAATISDPDAGSGELTLTLEATGGIFDIANDPGIVWTGNLTRVFTATGNLTNLNNYINSPTNIYFRPDSELNGNNAASVKVYISDNGNTGSGGGSKLLMGTVNVDITAVNDPPSISIPASLTVDEDVSTALTGISFSDVDAGSGNVTAQMSVGAGSLFALSGGGVTTSGNGSTSISLTGTIANINAYIAGSNVKFQNQFGNLANQTLSVAINDNGNTGSGGSMSDTGSMTITITAGNASPTAAGFVATNGPYENLTYTFSTSDFGYTDGDGDALDHVLIESIPAAGTLYVDADNNDIYDGGEAVSVNDQISKANLDVGNLQYIQNGSTNSSFQFEVNDGTENSTGNYVATLNVNPVPTVTLAITPSTKTESNTTPSEIKATLSNTYGINTAVGLSFSGTATGSGVDYSTSGTSITITPGNTTGTINVTNVPDALYEGNETVIIDIASVSGGTESGTQQVTYTIVDDDTPPNASLEILNIYNPITDESGGQAYVRGKIDVVAGTTITIPLNFSGTASGGGTDYSITGSTITLSPGEIRDSIRVTSIFDGVEEGDETIIIDMETPTNAVEDGAQQVTLTIKDEDITPPSGYSVIIDQSGINNANESAVSFTFAGAEVGATYNYNISSSGGGTNVTGMGTISTATDQITEIDLSGLGDGTITLSVTLTDTFGSTGTTATDTETKDTSAPSGYTVGIDQSGITTSNQSTASFTFAGAEVGSTYNYTLSSSGGGTNVTGTGTIATATDQISGIDLIGLGDGTITLSVILTDTFGNAGNAATDTETKDTTAPSAYTVSIDQSSINNGNQSSVSFTFAGAEVGTTYNYTISSSGGGTNVSGSGTIATATDQISGIDLSGLGDGTITLSVNLTDIFSNTGSPESDTETKDATAPSGYSVQIDQSPINSSNQTVTSFTFGGAEIGSTYNYTFSSSGSGTNVTGSGSIVTATDQINGIDLSGLGDGTITLSVILTDTFGNAGSAVTDTDTKDTSAPSGYSVQIDQSPINFSNQLATSFTFAGAEMGASYEYTLSSSGGGTNVTGSGSITTATDQVTGIDLSDLGDGTITLSVALTDAAGNTGSAATDTETKDTTAPSGYSINIDLLGEIMINVINETTIEFSGSGMEVGSTLNYSFTSSGGGTAVTGTETVTSASETFDNGGAGYDLSGLVDGTITLTVSLTDPAGNQGTNTTDTETKDAGPPAGYTISWDDNLINATEASSTSFTVSNAEVGTSASYSISSSGDGNTATVAGTASVSNTSQTVTIDVSALTNGTLTVQVTLTDGGGNSGSTESDNSAMLDQMVPSGYSVTFDQDPIDESNQGSVSYTFAGAEIGTTYNYIISSSGGGTNVTGSGTIATATDQITVIDLSGLGDGTITLSVTLTDAAGNTGSSSTDTSTKDTNEAPTASAVSINGTMTVGEQLKGTYTFTDANSDPESGSTYQWYRSDDNSGTGKTAISGANGQQYTLQAADQGKYISFEVTPNDGTDTGTAVESGLVGPVKVDQTISFPSIPNKTYGDVSFTLGDSQTDQGLTVTYTAADPTVVNITGNQATVLKAGNTQITAIQTGDGVTNAASPVVQTLTINKAALTVTANDQSKIYGSIDPALTVGYAGFVNSEDETVLGGTLSLNRAAGEEVGNYTIIASGYNSSNYTISYMDGSFAITQAALTVTADDQSKVYGDTDPSLTVSYSGFVNGDDETALGGTLDISRAAGEDVGTYAITVSGYTSSNYTISYVDGSFEITQAALTVTADDQSKVYGDTDPSLTVSYTGFVNGDDETALGGTLDISRAAGEDVGTYAITASGYTSSNYAVSYVDGSFEISQAVLTVTVDDQSKVYGDTDPSLTVSYTGFVNGDDETALGGTLDISRAAGEDVGTYAITASGYTSSNYAVSYVDGSFEISQAALTVTVDDQSKVYGDTDPSLTVSYSGFVNGDDETALGGTLNISRAAGEDVGTYAITASGYTSSNYTISYVDGSFEITQAALTVTADDQSKVYGDTDPSLTVSYSGFVNGDDTTALGGTLDVSRAAGEDVGTYAITASGYTSSNYAVSYTAGNFEITRATLMVTADDKSKVYGSTDPSLTVNYTGFGNGDDETALGGTLAIIRATGEDVGNYAITASGYTSDNYSINYTAGDFEITKATLTVLADDKSKVYGSVDPSLTVSYSGFENGDDETALGGTLAISRSTGEDVGNYAITASGYTSDNYTISYTTGNFEVTKATLTVTADDKNKVYGSADPSLTVSYSGFVNGDDQIALDGTLAIVRTTGEDVGNYAITASGYTSDNYTISYTTGNFEVTKATLTVTADDKNKVYGSVDPSLTVSYSGFENGDDEAALGGTLAIVRTTGEDVGNYAITATGYSSDNYTISYTAGNFEITQATLTVTADDKSKVFGTADPALTYVVSGLVNGDGMEVMEGNLDRSPGEEVGIYPINKGSLSTNSNYLMQFTGGEFTIEARKIEEVYEPAAVEVAWGVSYDEVILPETVLVRTEEDEMINLPVRWDRTGIDLRNRGSYTINGELVLPSSVSEDAPSPYMDVVVLPKPAPTDLLLDHTEFEASVENIQIAIGGLEVIDPVDDVHMLDLVPGAGDNQYFLLSGSALYWSSNEALAGRTSFTVVLQVMDADGNILEKSFTITRLRKSLDEIEIYNTFTPNQDGTNDTWGIEELKYYTGVRIMVFERSGKRVFLTTDPETRWDGTFNGKELAPGSYFWVVETGETDKVRRGTLNLLRR